MRTGRDEGRLIGLNVLSHSGRGAASCLLRFDQLVLHDQEYGEKRLEGTRQCFEHRAIPSTYARGRRGSMHAQVSRPSAKMIA